MTQNITFDNSTDIQIGVAKDKKRNREKEIRKTEKSPSLQVVLRTPNHYIKHKLLFDGHYFSFSFWWHNVFLLSLKCAYGMECVRVYYTLVRFSTFIFGAFLVAKRQFEGDEEKTKIRFLAVSVFTFCFDELMCLNVCCQMWVSNVHFNACHFNFQRRIISKNWHISVGKKRDAKFFWECFNIVSHSIT